MFRFFSMMKATTMALSTIAAIAIYLLPAKAAVTVYTSEPAFKAATSGITTLDFNGIAAPGTFVKYGRTASFGKVTFNSYFDLYVVDPANSPALFDYGTKGVLTAAHDIWANLPAGTTAVGTFINTRLYKRDTLYVNLSTGDSYTFATNGGAKNGFQFIGFVSDGTPITSIYFSTGLKNALVVDNFKYGSR